MKINKCKLGFHNWITNKSYEVHGYGVSGSASVCLDCGKIKSWGSIIIPEHFKKIQSDVINAKGEQK